MLHTQNFQLDYLNGTSSCSFRRDEGLGPPESLTGTPRGPSALSPHAPGSLTPLQHRQLDWTQTPSLLGLPAPAGLTGRICE